MDSNTVVMLNLEHFLAGEPISTEDALKSAFDKFCTMHKFTSEQRVDLMVKYISFLSRRLYRKETKMDPNAALKELLELTKEVQETEGSDHISCLAVKAERMAELIIALDAWIRKSGFLPERWDLKR